MLPGQKSIVGFGSWNQKCKKSVVLKKGQKQCRVAEIYDEKV